MDLSPGDPRRLIVSISDTSYYLSQNGAGHFSRPLAPTPHAGIMQFDPGDASGARIVGLSQSGTLVVESLDGGNSWRALGPVPDEMLNNGNPARPTGVRPSDIEISRQDPRIMYLSGSSGSVYRSGDRGASWSKVLAGSHLPE